MAPAPSHSQPQSQQPQPHSQAQPFAPRIPVIYGAAGIGAPGTFCKLTDARAAQPVFDAWLARCGPESAIDTSNLHGFGTSEKILADMSLPASVSLDTKVYPLAAGDHSAAKIRAAVQRSLDTLRGRKIRVLYLHAPDRATPWAETLEAVDAMWREGMFEQFGLSNYKSFEVAEIVTLCRARGWVAPSVYEGLYSALDRGVEVELLPCLRHFNIRFAAYSPLAGGYLLSSASAANGVSGEIKIPRGSHFDPRNPFGVWYQERYLPMGPAVRELREVLESLGLTLHGAAVRWLQHHSALRPTDLGIIFGGSKPAHVEGTLAYCLEGPLPPAAVRAIDACYANVRGALPSYNHDPAWYDPEVHGY
ncbi:aflatoxin B1-aldehyde reductase [Mycena latifolia]|nr:aflatoxin B1-aldehyde reductase [Mycena latifolia]